MPDETPNYYAQFSLWVGAVDQHGIVHVTSAEEGIAPEWRPLPQTWEENLDISLPAVKTVNQGAFTDVFEVDAHIPLGLNVTMTCYSFNQKGFALYDFAIERAENFFSDLSDVYIGIQADIDVPSGPADVNGSNDQIIALLNNHALAMVEIIFLGADVGYPKDVGNIAPLGPPHQPPWNDIGPNSGQEIYP